MVLSAAVEPILISAMRIRTESEKRMLLIGTGVPMTAIYANVSKRKSVQATHNIPCGTMVRMVGLGLDSAPRPGEKQRPMR